MDLRKHRRSSIRKQVSGVARRRDVSRPIAVMTAILGVSVLSSGCSMDALNSGQQVIEGASQLIENADGLVQAGTDLAEACVVAQAAWVPGVSPADARSAIDEALGIVRDVVASVPNAPGVGEIEGVLVTAQEALVADPTSTSLGVSSSTLETACALVTLGG